jgi:hypothetical protein
MTIPYRNGRARPHRACRGPRTSECRPGVIPARSSSLSRSTRCAGVLLGLEQKSAGASAAIGSSDGCDQAVEVAPPGVERLAGGRSGLEGELLGAGDEQERGDATVRTALQRGRRPARDERSATHCEPTAPQGCGVGSTDVVAPGSASALQFRTSRIARIMSVSGGSALPRHDPPRPSRSPSGGTDDGDTVGGAPLEAVDLRSDPASRHRHRMPVLAAP